MARSRLQQPLPPCYALVQPGLEEVAADEVTRELGGEVKKTSRGIVVFRVPEIDEGLLSLRTTEDVFLFAWGTDQLTYRAEDLDKIQRWTAREPDWPRLFQIHHGLGRRPKGRPTYHLVTQMEGQHGYLRRDARKALIRGLESHIPPTWASVEENASIEVWLTIDNATAVCGVRLSDRTMRHRTYKLEHRPASLRPTVAASLVRLADLHTGQVVLDPMCGAGTILAEALAAAERFRGGLTVLGGDIDFQAVKAASANLRRLGAPQLFRWDARHLPLASGSLDAVLSNPPFGKQLASPQEVGPLYKRMVREYDRILKPGGAAVLLVADQKALDHAVEKVRWKQRRSVPLRVLGQKAILSAWRKPAG